jgi:hypothetical protein
MRGRRLPKEAAQAQKILISRQLRVGARGGPGGE